MYDDDTIEIQDIIVKWIQVPNLNIKNSKLDMGELLLTRRLQCMKMTRALILFVVDLHMCVLVVDEDGKIYKLARMDHQVEVITTAMKSLKKKGIMDENEDGLAT
ncbi:hypothetical protein Tco_1204060 [Tanacetum coccineum]